MKWLAWIGFGLIGLVVLLAIPVWFPPLRSLVTNAVKPSADASEESGEADEHAGHEHHHDHAGHDEGNSIELSPQARKNIHLKVGEIQTTNYSRSITVPAIVVERPGTSRQKVSAPLTGVVTGVHIVANEVVTSGELLFNFRLTHEDLVKAQTEFIADLGKLDVEQRELARLQKIKTGIIAEKELLARQYEIEKLEAILKAHRHSLLLHGLAEEQIDQIGKDLTLIREMKVAVPFLHADSTVHSESEGELYRQAPNSNETPSPSEGNHEVQSKQFVISQLDVVPGEAVQTGQTLCVLTDYSELYIEGQAFEYDADDIVRAAEDGLEVTAFSEQKGTRQPEGIKKLRIAHVTNEIDRESRALHFYVDLPNEIARQSEQGGHKFVTWKYKPGQRMQLRVPVEEWKDVIVIPVDAIAQEGLETFVFVENGDHFDRQPVHVKYRDQFDAVIDNDGSIFPGDLVAMNSAHQLQMAIKNKSGGGADPHAGHHH